jgi:hypothetical protein
MPKLLLDAGTSWSKVLELYKTSDDFKNSPMSDFINYRSSEDNLIFYDKNGNEFSGRTFIFPSGMLSATGLTFDAATGHMVKNLLKQGSEYTNEVIALAYGTQKIVKTAQNLTVVDLGSRDVKWIKFTEGKYNDLDWNGSCGSATGATVEMLCKFME